MLRATFRKAQCISDARRHIKVGVARADLRLHAGEEMIFAAIPTDHYFYPRDRLAGCVERLYLDERSGLPRVAYQLLLVKDEWGTLRSGCCECRQRCARRDRGRSAN